MSKFIWTRKPDFHKLHKYFSYLQYWTHDSEISKHLKPREKIFYKWIKPGSRVLFIGVGLSALPKELKEKHNCRVYVNDISAIALRNQKKNGIEILKGNIYKKYLTGKYDYIICSEVLEHLAVPEILINHIYRKSKYYLFSIPNFAYYKYRLHILFSGRFITQWRNHPAEHLRYWSHKDFKDWLIAHDLRTVSHETDYQGLNFIKKILKNILLNSLSHFVCYKCVVK